MFIMAKFYKEVFTKNLARLIGVKRRLAVVKSKWQKIEVIETKEFGKSLFINSVIQFSEFDEYIYHECLVHPALLSYPMPRRILIIGGGDGCALREVLKHKCVERVILVDIDKKVIEVSKRFFLHLNKNSFADKRVKIVIDDGRDFVEKCKDKFDIIIADVTDPSGGSSKLYTKEFYSICKNKLRKDGIFVTHSSEPYIYQKVFSSIYKTLSSVFQIVRVYGAWIPSFGLFWTFMAASDSIDIFKIRERTLKRRMLRRKIETKYYSSELHHTLFLRSKDLGSILKKGKVSTDKNPISIPLS